MGQLNHRDFKVREAATRRLIEIGEAGRPLLEATATQPDVNPEVADRIKTVLKGIGRLTIRLNDQVSMELVRIPAGKFLMGSPENEKDRHAEEGPRHEVTISKPLFLGIHEVTQEQYEAVLGQNPSRFKWAANPVENVSWNNAVEFCKRASEKTGKRFRLPTEAEWEYACRAGTKTRFNFGDDDEGLNDHGWHSGNSESKTHPVGQKKPNAWGLYDMHGNVWEWCADWYDEKYYGRSPKADPTGPAGGKSRALRGGSWLVLPGACRVADRRGSDPDTTGDYFGFRVAVAAGVD
jgi:eukaryotic-like serine/threonine-protein kinase